MIDKIEYDWPLYRPPSEASSLIFQVTLGCSHNRCAFCTAFQNKSFKIRPEKELFDEIDWALEHATPAPKVFLADGDAMAISPKKMVRILDRLYKKIPGIKRVTAYASPQNLLSRTVEELKSVRESGMNMLYFGLESGDNQVLQRINKGATCEEMIKACNWATKAGFDLSITAILGLAGPKGSKRHAKATAQALDQICPKYVSALTLMLPPRTPSYSSIYNDPEWRPLNTIEALEECRHMLANIQKDGLIFRSNHASNYLALKGDLQTDKQKLLDTIDQALNDPDSPLLRPEFLRSL